MGLLQGIVDIATVVISQLGYTGVFFLMALESMVAPVPSEAVMPFAGFLVATGEFSSVLMVTLVATLGTIAGSFLSYWIGARWGDRFVRRHGRWLLVAEHDWVRTQNFFRERGGWSIFLSRFIPVIRHLISMPAGAAKMDKKTFLIATAAGGFIWNWILAYFGFRLGENWERIGAILEPFEYLIVGALIVGIAIFVYIHVRRNGRE